MLDRWRLLARERHLGGRFELVPEEERLRHILGRGEHDPRKPVAPCAQREAPQGRGLKAEEDRKREEGKAQSLRRRARSPDCRSDCGLKRQKPQPEDEMAFRKQVEGAKYHCGEREPVPHENCLLELRLARAHIGKIDAIALHQTESVPLVEGIRPGSRGSMAIAARITLARPLNRLSAMWWLFSP